MVESPDIRISDLHCMLAPATGKLPFEPVVSSLHVLLGNGAVEKGVRVALELGRDRSPVDLEFRSAQFVDEGAEIIVQVSKGRFFKTDVRALIGISAEDADHVRVEIREVKALGKLPIDAFVEPVLDKVLAKAASRSGVTRAGDGKRALLLQPELVLADFGLPFRFGPGGAWTVCTTEGILDAHFTTR